MKMMSRKKTKISFNNLPIEILTLILGRMMGKILLRVRSVCKFWRSIIDDPDFVHLHLQFSNMKNNTKEKLFVAFEVGLDNCLKTIRRADTFRKTGHNLMSFKNPGSLGSCNGLILIWTYFYAREEWRLWNPSIRKSLLIPPCPILYDWIGTTAFVFGFVPSTKEHKILAITFYKTKRNRPKDISFAVYTLGDQEWTVRRNSFNNVERSCFEGKFWSNFYSSNKVYFQGAVHCIGNDLYKDNKDYLISLDIDLEEFKFLELPYSSADGRYTNSILFTLGESLAVFRISEVNASIWVLELDGGKRVWTQWFSRPSTRDGYDLFNDPAWCSKAAFYYKSDDGGCLIIGKKSYHIASGKVRERGKSMKKNVKLETYLESLVLHKGYGAQDDVDVFPVN